MEFNVNNSVRVKLTDKGRALHAADHAMFWAAAGRGMPYTPPKEDAGGYSCWQMWSLMQAFGNHLRLGEEMPFEPTIILDDK